MYFSRNLVLTAVLPLISSATQTIEVPKSFCELDRKSECQVGQCLRYDPKKFPNSRSVVTFFAGGRLGNKISAYLNLLWVHLDHDQDVYYEKESFEVLDRYFENINIPTLEDGLCDWRTFPFQKYEGNIEELGDPEWKTGKAIEIFVAKKNFMRHEIMGGRKYYRQFRDESVHALKFRPQFQRHADITLGGIAKKADLKGEIVFVGVHNRRTDYLEFRKKRLGLENLYEDYFQDAMEYFREEYDNPIFVYVSDDMKWGRRNLKTEKDIFFVGCGDPDDVDCIGKDFAVLSNCNHTITTHGTFGHWAAYLAGGEIYTEYGAIVPDAYN